MSYLMRLSYNSSGWQHPTAEAADLEAGDTFNSLNRFGFEDWFCRGEWQVDGWRHAFLQGANIKGRKYIGTPMNVSLYTKLPDKRRCWVADVSDLECLDPDECKEAEALFREQGWLRQMQEEVAAVGGDPAMILDTPHSGHFLNVRYRLENLNLLPAGTACPDFFWQGTAAYYNFYPLTEHPDAGDAAGLPVIGPAGRDEPLPAGPIYRRGVGAVQYTPQHKRMQARLLAHLQGQFGRERVRIEVDGIDAVVVTDEGTRLYEIKTYHDPCSVIREALGQILEYTYHPAREHRLPVRMIIVGPVELRAGDAAYLDHLTAQFGLPLEYLPLLD